MHTFLQRKEKDMDQSDVVYGQHAASPEKSGEVVARKREGGSKRSESAIDRMINRGIQRARAERLQKEEEENTGAEFNAGEETASDQELQDAGIDPGGMESGDMAPEEGVALDPSETLRTKPETIQKASDGTSVASAATENKINTMRASGGAPLDQSTREFMEARMGHDFSDVRVHTGGDAESTSADLGAKAYTVGKDIAFNKGEYQPESQEGKKLLAHELTHTIQQGGVQRKVQNETIQRRSQQPVFKSKSARQRAIRTAAAKNRKKWPYSVELMKLLRDVSGNWKAYNAAIKEKRYGSNFVWLVGDAQAELNLKITGFLDDHTFEKIVQDKRDSMSVSLLTWLYKTTLNGAIAIIKFVKPERLGLIGPLAGLVKAGAIGFLQRLAKLRDRKIGRTIKNVARALISWPFIKNFGIGFYEGFVYEGALGFVKPFWDMRHVPAKVYKFGRKVYRALGDSSVSKAAQDLINKAYETVTWLKNNGIREIWAGIKKKIKNPNPGSVIAFFTRLYQKAKLAAKSMGGKIAGKIEEFFGGSVKDIGATLGALSGKASGFVTFEAIVLALTLGTSSVATGVKLAIKPFMTLLTKGMGKVLKVVRIIWNALTKWLGGVMEKITKWLSKMPSQLGSRLKTLVTKVKAFFQKVMERLKGGIRKRRDRRRKVKEKKTQKKVKRALKRARKTTKKYEKRGRSARTLRRKLLGLKFFFSWIKGFKAKEHGSSNIHEITMVASSHVVEPRYNPNTAIKKRYDRAVKFFKPNQEFTSKDWAMKIVRNPAGDTGLANSDLAWGLERSPKRVIRLRRSLRGYVYIMGADQRILIELATRIIREEGRNSRTIKTRNKGEITRKTIENFCIKNKRLPNSKKAYPTGIFQKIIDVLLRKKEIEPISERTTGRYKFTGLPAKRLLPLGWKGDHTRERYYITGSKFKSNSEIIWSKFQIELAALLTRLKFDIRKNKYTTDEARDGRGLNRSAMRDWDELFLANTFPAKPNIEKDKRHARPRQGFNYKNRDHYDVDHDMPLAWHWSKHSKPGNNSAPGERKHIAEDMKNLVVVNRAYNRRKKAKYTPPGGVESTGVYYDWVGPKFDWFGSKGNKRLAWKSKKYKYRNM